MGVTEFTVRELCNVAYFLIVDQFQPSEEEGGDTVQDQVERFEEKIGQRISSESKAEELMRASMIARGLDPDAKPELSPELKAKMEEDAMKDMSGEDLFFSERAQSGKEFMGQKIKD